MSEQNRATLLRMNDQVIRGGEIDVVDELLSDDFVEHDPPPGMSPDRDGFKEFIRSMHAGLVDIVYTVDDQVVESDRVVERWTLTGTHAGPWLGVSPTGKRVTFTGIDISRLAAGRIVEHWTELDLYGLFGQLGSSPADGGDRR
jgi:predicted ester cyclase